MRLHSTAARQPGDAVYVGHHEVARMHLEVARERHRPLERAVHHQKLCLDAQHVGRVQQRLQHGPQQQIFVVNGGELAQQIQIAD